MVALASASAVCRSGRTRPTDNEKVSSSGTPTVRPVPVITSVRGPSVAAALVCGAAWAVLPPLPSR